MTKTVVATLVGLMLFSCVHALSRAELLDRVLSARNTEVPFCYVAGASRSWPVFAGKLGRHDELVSTARKDGKVLADGTELTVEGLRVDVSRDGFLTIVAPVKSMAACASGSSSRFVPHHQIVQSPMLPTSLTI